MGVGPHEATNSPATRLIGDLALYGGAGDRPPSCAGSRIGGTDRWNNPSIDMVTAVSVSSLAGPMPVREQTSRG